MRVDSYKDFEEGKIGGEMKNDGGPAFPFAVPGSLSVGMSLRDYFAEGRMPNVEGRRNLTAEEWDTYAKAAYMAADAMLKEREVVP